jgi:hypothetical protein
VAHARAVPAMPRSRRARVTRLLASSGPDPGERCSTRGA